jgi:uncharacterized protein YbjT (DUF2867 family)
VARLARESGVERLIHVSGIGADPASSVPYIAACSRGEIAVQQAFPCGILIRPVVMFGPDDAFLTTVIDSPLEGAGFEPSVPLVRPVPELLEKGTRAFLHRGCGGAVIDGSA